MQGRFCRRGITRPAQGFARKVGETGGNGAALPLHDARGSAP
jgi:hypothetical protein